MIERSKPASQLPPASMPAEANVIEETMASMSCRGNANRPVEVIQYRHIAISESQRGERRSVGAIGWRTSDGEPVRQIDRNLYVVVSSGELLERID
tara:strand:- start:43 stop:330 length:288 start_codon:yes stop_codon:yes gene_type:complete